MCLLTAIGLMAVDLELTEGRVNLLILLGSVGFCCFVGWLDAEIDARNGIDDISNM
jgi:hypothetical protein